MGGPFTHLFPEFAGSKIADEERQNVRDPYPFSRHHVLVQPGGYFIRRSLVERIHALSATIHAAVAQPDCVLDLVGNTMRESVLWAAVTDVYPAPNGSTQHKVGWLTNAPGISYSPPSLTEQPREGRSGA